MPEALTNTGGRRSAGVRPRACTRTAVADNRLERSSAIRCRVHGQRPMLAPARLMTPCAPASSSTQSPLALRALFGRGEQRNPIELTALAGGHAGIDRKADDVTVRTGRIGMLFENRPQPIRLPDRDRPIGFRDDEAELAVLDAGQRVDAARLRTDDRNEFAKHPAEATLAVLAAQNFEGFDLEQHHGEVVVVTRGATDLFFKKVLQERLAVGS